ncbi:MAG TPA: hypothetical protein VKB80_00910 [Kofleriaceae bacterium]|nr:hypothetical protein [Kofleriaceae bacterium]
MPRGAQAEAAPSVLLDRYRIGRRLGAGGIDIDVHRGGGKRKNDA